MKKRLANIVFILTFISLVEFVQQTSQSPIRKRQVCTTSPLPIAIPGNCYAYQLCSNGQLFTFSCPPTLLFDSNLLICNHPSLVTGVCATNTFSQNLCTIQNDLTPIPTDCTKFFRCANGITMVFDCPPNTVFDSVHKVCVHPANAAGACASFVSTSTSQTTNPSPITASAQTVLSTISSSPDCLPEQDLTPIAGECTRFNRCYEGNFYIAECIPGTVFDNVNKECNYPTEVKGICGSIKGTPNCPSFSTSEILKLACSSSAFKNDYPNCCI